MRNLMKACVMSVAIFMLMCGVASATSFNAQGSAVVAGVDHRYVSNVNFYSTSLRLSNITGETVQCKVTVFNHDGEDISSYGTIRTGGSPNYQELASGTDTFDIPPYSTRSYELKSSRLNQSVYGYAVVEWTSNNPKLRKALIGVVTRLMVRPADVSTSQTERDINNGRPF
ncbi:hypothetical protein [Maridesulfovibrio salexigens]|uniref:Uncharacterized protein n=1 Tax=Maridesulfovibrio salexigens (strain ATCC 14822 / DSM 2638 / NCIMB 8403 / VKM B-1763) TaxID=526222 RepID=C6BVL4_MARSD|nr:hypothetical protein [Maridesulfovibrio salexigens]ACS78228.1 conserved hypothetical protein [Maridesulfovibrio salexigens DSM 2638]